MTCVIPGHDRTGTEVVCDVLRVEDAPLCFEMTARCGYESTFDYTSERRMIDIGQAVQEAESVRKATLAEVGPGSPPIWRNTQGEPSSSSS